MMVLMITVSLVIFPDQSLEASLRGLNVWWEVVFPSLLPFFITAELLIAFGVVRFVGVLFEPIMRPLFNVPGAGSFAWMMGMASGYPSGAKISVRLREEKQVSQIEAERLLSFTNASSPLFIFGAISVGFFHDAKLGLLLAVCHYLGNTLVGICMRFYGRSHKSKTSKKRKVSIKHAFEKMHQMRVNDTRPIGEILGDAVLNSIKTLVMVGGFIIFFSVLTRLLFLIGITSFLAAGLENALYLLSLPGALSTPILSGLFEITIGAQMISQLDIEFLAKIIVVSFILGFNGFSVQAQVASIIASTDIRFTPYFISRIMHACFASFLTIILFKPLYINRVQPQAGDVPVTMTYEDSYFYTILETLQKYGPLLTVFSLGLGVWLIYSRVSNKRL